MPTNQARLQAQAFDRSGLVGHGALALDAQAQCAMQQSVTETSAASAPARGRRDPPSALTALLRVGTLQACRSPARPTGRRPGRRAIRQIALEVLAAQARPRRVMHQHPVRIGSASPRARAGRCTPTHRGERRPSQVRTRLDDASGRSGQSVSPGASATTMPARLGSASSAASVHDSMGRPSNGAYCFGTPEPNRMPCPAAGTMAQRRSPAVISSRPGPSAAPPVHQRSARPAVPAAWPAARSGRTSRST